MIEGNQFRLVETAAEFDPTAIALWSPYKSEQTVEVDADGAHLKGPQGAGLWTTIAAAELGLLAVEADVDVPGRRILSA